MSPTAFILWTNLAVILGTMLLLWVVATARRDVSIVDIFWGAGFAIVAWTSWLLGPRAATRELMTALLTTLWGLRLAAYLLWRKRGEEEDRRYAAMRTHHGRRFWWVSLLTVFLLQGLLMWLIAIPLQVVGQSARPLNMIDALGCAFWALGFLFESIGDFQMARFQATPGNRGRVMQNGLWRYTRHPNYFGDFCVWWGLFLIAAGGGAWWTILSPIVMSILLLRVSGVSLLESSIGDRRPEYAEYQRRTNVFFPGPPRRHDA